MIVGWLVFSYNLKINELVLVYSFLDLFLEGNEWVDKISNFDDRLLTYITDHAASFMFMLSSCQGYQNIDPKCLLVAISR